MESTTANPGGMTTIGERWTRGDSKNHMILAQIEEWFQSHLAGIRPATGSVAYGKLLFQPKPVGDLSYVQGSYKTPQGIARSSWTRSGDRFQLKITVPPNTTAEVRIPTDGTPVQKPTRATFVRTEGNHTIYTVPSGEFTFTTTKS
jgi:alpha-L-rhamnosidase